MTEYLDDVISPTSLVSTRVVLWDLDGTLTDSGPAITSAIQQALVRCGLPPVSTSAARKCVGPPLLHGLPAYCGVSEERLAEVVAVYREIYQDIMCEAPLYPGVRETLEACADAGLCQAIATAKPEGSAREILAHHDLMAAFDVVTGADESEGRLTKDAVIATCLDRLDEAGIREPREERFRICMIGDRFYDMEGAATYGLQAIFAAWGYGSAAEAGDFPPAGDLEEVAQLLGLTVRRDLTRA
ncbi:MAG: HAD hydrolase-like protein [Bowdeniella nasicola]|nr:HAD hydrolase-like protein [Bowdeniella nasicola]